MLWVAPLAAQSNLLSFISRPCPSNISSPQVHMAIPINVGGISIPFIICASLGPGVTLDLSGAVPMFNVQQAPAIAGQGVACPTPQSCFGISLVSNPDGSVAPAVNTASVLSKDQFESGGCQFLDSTNGTPQYTAGLALGCKALSSYKAGQVFVLRVDATNAAGACSLNIDNLGLRAIKQRDGVTDPGPGTVAAGQFYWVFYDGQVFRLN
jgi:hypothetical protein